MGANIPLKYGDVIYILNGLKNWAGGYMDVCNNSQYSGAKYNVYTCSSKDRAGKATGSWTVESAVDKKIGNNVLSCDFIFLKNMYLNDGGYLSIAQSSGGIATFDKQNQDRNAMMWRIFAEKKDLSESDGVVYYGDTLRFFNGFINNGEGCFLDASGSAGFDPELYNVTTTKSSCRVSGSSLWVCSK